MNFLSVLRSRVRKTSYGFDSSCEGFTLIELLVVIIVVAILSAIALPAFLNQAQRARHADAQSKVGTILRGQQAYYMEHGRFADSLESLQLGITQSADYTYASDQFNDHQTLAGHRVSGARAAALPQPNARGYMGKIWVEVSGNQPMVYSVICEGDWGARDFMQSKTYCP
ncbi:MAG: type IV pilin protein [Almyronema sp.]